MSHRKKFCIVAGAPRSGTTSLYNYICSHPDVSGSYVKQTNYFIDLDFEGILSNPVRHYSDTSGSYSDVFAAQAFGMLSVEASPDYIYSPSSAKAIFQSIGGSVHLVFLLRNPVEQFLSFWQHYIGLGLIPVDSDIDEFISEKFASVDAAPLADIPFFVGKGCYAAYLKSYCELFSPEDLVFLFTEDLSQDAGSVMSGLSKDIGLDSRYYDGYDFQQFNGANTVKSSLMQKGYRQLRRAGLSLIGRNPGLAKVLEPIRVSLGSGYKKLNTSAIQKQSMSQQSRNSLVEYYRADYENLKKIIKKDPPWPDFAD